VRPDRLVLVVGTGTEVGKTWVAARLLAGLRAAGLRVAARKPAQSFDPGDPPAGLDAAVLASASGEQPDEVCLAVRSYERAMAPPMAAAALGRPGFSVADLLDELRWPDPGDAPGAPVGGLVGVVETAGGVRSPQADDGDAVDLARALAPDVVLLVADAGLGVINAVRLSVGALQAAGPATGSLPGARTMPTVVVVLNRFDAGDPVHRANRDWLADVDGLRVLCLPGDESALVAAAAGAG